MQELEEFSVNAPDNLTYMSRNVSASTNQTNTTVQTRPDSAADSDIYNVDTSTSETVSFRTLGSPSSESPSSMGTSVQASPNVPTRRMLNINARKRLLTSLHIDALREPLAKVTDDSPDVHADDSPVVDTSVFGVNPLEYPLSPNRQIHRNSTSVYGEILHFTPPLVCQDELIDELTNDSQYADLRNEMFDEEVDDNNEYQVETPVYQVDLGLGLSTLIRSSSKDTHQTYQTQQTQTNVQEFVLGETRPQITVLDDLALIPVKSMGDIKHVLKMIIYECDIGCVYYETHREIYILLRQFVCKTIKQSDPIYCVELSKILTDILQSDMNVDMNVNMIRIIVILSMILPPTETVVKFQSLVYRLFHALHYDGDIFEYSVDIHRCVDRNLLIYIQGNSCKKYRTTLDSLSTFLESIWNTQEKIDIHSIYQNILQTNFA